MKLNFIAVLAESRFDYGICCSYRQAFGQPEVILFISVRCFARRLGSFTFALLGLSLFFSRNVSGLRMLLLSDSLFCI